ncbi:hypothetical protein BRC72_11545 [Halobacteriales archaeon QH_7_66_36]|nr:MAG: hypothetical protein BRC72_11545 [Halobacteriales archaeon QH_7_66_36]
MGEKYETNIGVEMVFEPFEDRFCFPGIVLRYHLIKNKQEKVAFTGQLLDYFFGIIFAILESVFSQDALNLLRICPILLTNSRKLFFREFRVHSIEETDFFIDSRNIQFLKDSSSLLL